MSCTSRAPRPRSTTWSCRSRPSRWAPSAPTRPWGWPRSGGPSSCSRRPPKSTAIRSFVRQALRNEPITVFGDGSQTRSFTYVSDLVEGIWALMQAPINEPVNIGNPREMTLLQLARQIIQMSGSRSEVVFRPLPTDDPKVRQPDITKARRVLGWEPKVEVEDGLRRTIDWCRRLVTEP